MYIYSEDAGKSLKAIYFDSEHVIHYDVRSLAPNVAVFEGSGYRITYKLEGETLAGKFEVGGKTYLDWAAVRSDRSPWSRLRRRVRTLLSGLYRWRMSPSARTHVRASRSSTHPALRTLSTLDEPIALHSWRSAIAGSMCVALRAGR